MCYQYRKKNMLELFIISHTILIQDESELNFYLKLEEKQQFLSSDGEEINPCCCVGKGIGFGTSHKWL